MTIIRISDIAKSLREKYNEKDPAGLARELGILVAYEPMGVYDGCCKGFFIAYKRRKHITVNSDLPAILQRVVLAHELGHAVLHAGEAADFHDIALFDAVDRREYEANVFAAELLLPDDDVLRLLNEDIFFFQAAGILTVPFELLDFKFRILKRRGYKLESPVCADGNFLKNLERSAASAELPSL